MRKILWTVYRVTTNCLRKYIGVAFECDFSIIINHTRSSFLTRFQISLISCSLGLGEGNNEDFVAWVEPYEFFNAKIMGTTVSAPAFDRSVDPPVLIGVVGMDFPMSALDRALGVPLGSTATFDRVVRSSTAVCPDLDISTCQVESFRRIGPAGNEASCTSNCTESDLVNVEAQACRNQDDFPTDIIANRDVEFVDLEERSCCIVGTSEPSSVCPRTGGIVGDPDNDFARSGNDSGSVGVGIIVAIVVVVVLVSAGAAAVCFYMRRKKSNNKPNHPNNNGNKPSRKTHTGSSSYPTSAIHEAQQPEPVTNLHVMPPPSNPHASTASAPSQDIHA